MKVSIAMSYYNRKKLLINTLKTIQRSVHKDIEVVIADDCSAPEHRLEDILEEYPFVKLIRLEAEDRWYTNPCVPFNKAIRATTGDIVIIQNPECLHAGDILNDLVTRIKPNDYLTYAVYSADQEKTEFINDLPFDNEHIFHMIKSQLQPMANITYQGEGTACWYNHSVYRPDSYHFLGAMFKTDMDDLGGFDEKYSNGVGFDDDEFLYRIRLKSMATPIQDLPFAVHQWHYGENKLFNNHGHESLSAALRKNQTIFNNETKQNRSWRVANIDNVPKNH